MLMFPDRDTRTVRSFSRWINCLGSWMRSAAWGASHGRWYSRRAERCDRFGKDPGSDLSAGIWMEQQIGNIAEQIAADPRKKIILIAGPSSSGEDDLFPPSVHSADGAGACGRIRFPLDDFYVNREDTPKDENGEYDFECLEAIDIPLLNRCLNDLLAGKEVLLPVFNFRTGRREYRGQPLQIGRSGCAGFGGNSWAE